jgi:ABC-type branched-subunit amino acid transport system substrate-binding protein
MQIYDGTGPAATPEVTQGATAAVKAINAKGGVGGHHLDLIECNTLNDPNTATQCGQKAVSDGVVALIGSSTQYATNFLPNLASHQIADFGAIPAGVGDFTSPASFPIVGGPPVTIAALPYFLAQNGHKQIAIVYPDLPAATFAGSLGNEVLKPFGVQLTASVAVPVTAPDLSSYIASATAQQISGIAEILPGQQAVQFIQQVRSSSPKTVIALEATNISSTLKALGSQAAGLIESSDFLPLNVPSPVTTQYKHEMASAGYKNLTGFREDPWLAVHTFATMYQKLSSPTAGSFYSSLSQATGVKTGITPPLQWTHGGVGGFPRLFNACEVEEKLTKSGQANSVNGKFYNPFTNTQCPQP